MLRVGTTDLQQRSGTVTIRRRKIDEIRVVDYISLFSLYHLFRTIVLPSNTFSYMNRRQRHAYATSIEIIMSVGLNIAVVDEIKHNI
jgi:hypothetical protein